MEKIERQGNIVLSPEQYRGFLEDNQRSTAEAIRVTVNGKIDTLKGIMDQHNDKHEKDMQRIMPVIEAFEESKQFAKSAKTSGLVILWLAGFITAVGSAFLILRSIFLPK